MRVAVGAGSRPVVGGWGAWLNGVPAGPDLGPLAVPGRGGPGPTLGGQVTRVGQVLVVHNVASPDECYLAESGGAAPVTPTQAPPDRPHPAPAAAYHRATASDGQ